MTTRKPKSAYVYCHVDRHGNICTLSVANTRRGVLWHLGASPAEVKDAGATIKRFRLVPVAGRTRSAGQKRRWAKGVQ